MKTSKELETFITEESANVAAILKVAEDGNRALTEDESTAVNAWIGTGENDGKLAKCKQDLDDAKKREQFKKEMVRNKMEPAIKDMMPAPKANMPATARRHGKLRAFKDEFDAYASGRFLQASLLGNQDAAEWCRTNGIKAAMSATDNSTGGFLVPDAFESSVLRYVEEYSVARNYASVMPMISDVTNIPRREGGLTVYYPGENTAITTSTPDLGQIKLVAIKRATLTALSSELSEDSAIAIADFLAAEIGTAFSKKADEDCFLGDGTSTYGGVTGLKSALAAGSVVDAASGNVSFATFDLADFENCIAALPVFADNANTAWFISKAGYAKSMLNLMNAAGGNTNVTLSDGVRSRPMFMGYPVVFTQAMPSADVVSTNQVYLGDLSQAVHLGVRTGLTVATDMSVYFASDQIGVRATERLAINVHERGTASAAGSIIALRTAAS